jgi:hypothetical protein
VRWRFSGSFTITGANGDTLIGTYVGRGTGIVAQVIATTSSPPP